MNMHHVNNWFTVVNQVAKENERRVAMNSAGRNSAYQKVQHAMVEIDYYIFGFVVCVLCCVLIYVGWGILFALDQEPSLPEFF